MNKFAQDIENKLSFLFKDFKTIPSINEENRKKFTFLAQLRKDDSIQKIQNTLYYLKSGLEIENSKSVKSGHKFWIGENRVNLFYVSEGHNFNFFYDVSSYGVNFILGKIINSFGLKLSQEGLLYEEKLGIENHNSKVGEFLITDNAEKLFSFLKLDYNRFKVGFVSKNDLFSFLASCPYLRPEKFTEPKKEHKLPIYQDFQAFLILNPVTEPRQKMTFQDIDNFFEDVDFLKEVEKLKQKEIRKREVVQKFNGKVILDYYPDFDRNKIGTSMGYFKFSFKDVEDYRNFLFDNDLDNIMCKFKEVVRF